ncbi:GNAT family N-acetyltransferase (plasmid) [Pseudoalteromonas sp. T1lg65]|uniref:GNAT family N-acetyltransferase n=1 Tax=Pseudoalteromonas sp. T1lg65 TaxID=2077101 RepID=UPI003F7B2093
MSVILLSHIDNDQIEQLTTLYINTFSAPPRNEVIDRNTITALMKKEITEGEVRILIDESGKNIIASLSVTPIEHFKDRDQFNLHTGLYISNFMVDGQIRGKGLGKILLADTLAKASQPIHTRCREDAGAVNHLFQKSGFELVATYTTSMNNSIAKRNIYTYFPK